MESAYPAEIAIAIPVGPGRAEILDTLDSIGCYCSELHTIVMVDDYTQDGTYDALCERRLPNWHILRNKKKMGVWNLVRTLCTAYRHILETTRCKLVLRLDQDALVIAPGVLSEAVKFADRNPDTGLFGVYEHDYDRPRSFQMHKKQMDRELAFRRRMLGHTPCWRDLLRIAEDRGYKRGENVFGGAYFLTRQCLERMAHMGSLDVDKHWNSRLMEDVYFSLATVGAGYQLGQFGAPEGPLCLEWRGLPYTPEKLHKGGYKIVHSVDKGKNTDRASNGGLTAREVFRNIRSVSI